MAINLITDLAGLGALSALTGTLLIISVIGFIAVYIYCAIAMMAIAKKTNTDKAWMAWIPIANLYLVTQIAEENGWWTLMVFASFIPFIGSLAMLVVGIWLLWKVAERVDYPGWTSLLMLVPIVNLIALGLWAWAKK